MSISNQQYWLNLPSVYGETDRAKRYVLGDTVQATKAPARIKGTWQDNKSRGTANQNFYTQYSPVVEGTDAVYVNGVKWNRVEQLDGAGSENVYTFDPAEGKISFGDGKNGNIPPKDATITIDYQHRHAGFMEYYDAMKAVDPSIKIFANLPYTYNFITDGKCDGIVYHNYIDFPSDLKTKEEVHDTYIDISDRLVKMIDSNVSELRERSVSQDTIAAVTEFGSINIPAAYSEDTSAEGRDEARSLSRALSFATTYIGSAKAESLIHIHQAFTAYSFGGGPGITNADQVYNSLYAPYADDPTTFIESGTALAYKLIGNNTGSTVRNSYIQNNPVVTRHKEYEALNVLATQEDENGDLYLMVVNRDSENDIAASLNLKGYAISGKARIQTLNAEDVASCNTPEHPEDIKITEQQVVFGEGESSFSYTFPAHSIVAIKLSGKSTDFYEENFPLRHFSAVEVGKVPEYFELSNGTAFAQNDTAGNRAFEIKRAGADTKVKGTLSGQAVNSTEIKTYDGLMKIKFKLKAKQTGGRLEISVLSNGKKALEFALENGAVKNDGSVRAIYTNNQFHDIEIVLDHKAGQYVLYFDGSYIGSPGKYNAEITDPLDYIQFEAKNQDASYVIDDFLIESADDTMLPKITQIDAVERTTEVGEAPSLPDKVTARYNTGEDVEMGVTWDDIDPSQYAAEGVYEVAGTVSELNIPARAVITVVKPIHALTPIEIQAVAGTSPQLPASMEVEYISGEKEIKSIIWDEIDPVQYQSAGEFIVEGTIDGVAKRPQAKITVIAKADVPIITVEAFTKRADQVSPLKGNRVDSFVENNAALAGSAQGALQSIVTKENNTLYLTVINHNKKEDIGAAFNLKGYVIKSEAAVRTADYVDESSLGLWENESCEEISASLGIGESSFSYVIPAGAVVSIKVSGTSSADPWTENFQLRHFSAVATGQMPTYFSKVSGAASSQQEPGNAQQQVFMLKRDNTDTLVKATLSGKDFPVSEEVTYDGLLQIKLSVKPSQQEGRFSIQLLSQEDVALEIEFNNGKIISDGKEVGSYQANQWYKLEVVLDHQAKEYSVYNNGNCLAYNQGYSGTAVDALDYAAFCVTDTNSTFYIDDFYIRSMDVKMESKITQIDSVFVTTKAGNKPALPSQVTVRYNTGESDEREVIWQEIEPSLYEQPGRFTVIGAVDGTVLEAAAQITVEENDSTSSDISGSDSSSDVSGDNSSDDSSSDAADEVSSGDSHSDVSGDNSSDDSSSDTAGEVSSNDPHGNASEDSSSDNHSNDAADGGSSDEFLSNTVGGSITEDLDHTGKNENEPPATSDQNTHLLLVAISVAVLLAAGSICLIKNETDKKSS